MPRRSSSLNFNDDRKDAGEIGAGHHATALYEIVPVDDLKDRRRPESTNATFSGEWLNVKLR